VLRHGVGLSVAVTSSHANPATSSQARTVTATGLQSERSRLSYLHQLKKTYATEKLNPNDRGGIDDCAPAAKANDGDLDLTFGTGGQVLTDFARSADLANAVALQADGKLVVGGTTYTNNDFSGEDFALARYNSDGTLDPGFGARGKVTTDFPGMAAVISAIVIQPDSKIVVTGGSFSVFVIAGDLTIARYQRQRHARHFLWQRRNR